ncbi:MAG TPA: hypothetical protein VKW09_11180 [bacterium]|nr:hypothetical protein [bacterium]
MMRRFTVACGLLTLATLFVLARQGLPLSGAQPWHSAEQVTVIPDKPMFWPPVKPLPSPPLKARPPVLRPEPLHPATFRHSQ